MPGSAQTCGRCTVWYHALYSSSRPGIGRVNAIIPTPNGRVANLGFGGPNFDILYATCGDRVYRRKVKVKGANSYEAPIQPPTPHL